MFSCSAQTDQCLFVRQLRANNRHWRLLARDVYHFLQLCFHFLHLHRTGIVFSLQWSTCSYEPQKHWDGCVNKSLVSQVTVDHNLKLIWNILEFSKRPPVINNRQYTLTDNLQLLSKKIWSFFHRHTAKVMPTSAPQLLILKIWSNTWVITVNCVFRVRYRPLGQIELWAPWPQILDPRCHAAVPCIHVY